MGVASVFIMVLCRPVSFSVALLSVSAALGLGTFTSRCVRKAGCKHVLHVPHILALQSLFTVHILKQQVGLGPLPQGIKPTTWHPKHYYSVVVAVVDMNTKQSLNLISTAFLHSQ